MASILDPPIPRKIRKMNERVSWGHPLMKQRQIDQTRLILVDGHSEDADFSFLVIGDSGSGPHPSYHPQRRLAIRMAAHLEECRFLLHTGDVVYQVGSSEQYLENFIKPYREWLVGGHEPERISYSQMVFKFPFLAVPGNHDYYNLPWAYGLMAQLSKPIRQALGIHLEPNVGWHGSYDGDAYARAFLNYLKDLSLDNLEQHLTNCYKPVPGAEDGRGLAYMPGEFTRLPNRYYRFTYGGIDFFALDSSTFNAPSPLPSYGEGGSYRAILRAQRQAAKAQIQQVVDEASRLSQHDSHAHERLADLQAKVEQLEEVLLDIDKQLSTKTLSAVDVDQLLWLRDGLIESWGNSAVRGRIIFFHHPPYVSEATKVNQGQTLAVRHHLRWVLDEVASTVTPPDDRPLIDLVLNGHAHCFEYLRTLDTGHGDRNLNWLVCGSGGLSLRRQQAKGPEIHELFPGDEPEAEEGRVVAKSQIYMGLTGHKTERRRPYSFLRIDVKAGASPQFIIRPYISERYHQQWRDYELDPLVL